MSDSTVFQIRRHAGKLYEHLCVTKESCSYWLTRHECPDEMRAACPADTRCHPPDPRADTYHVERRGAQRRIRREIPLAPFERLTPRTLCQQADVLLNAVSVLDYDLTAPGFVDYLAERGYSHLLGERGGVWEQYVGDTRLTRDDFERDVRVARSADGSVPYSTEHRDSLWHSVLLSRVMVQDAWDVWRSTR